MPWLVIQTPYYDDCAAKAKVGMSSANKNIGDLLRCARKSRGAGIPGGFTPSSVTEDGTCSLRHHHGPHGRNRSVRRHYKAHHEPFEYYASTANIHHTLPASLSEVGHSGPANHQYDLSYFQKAALAGNLPAVSYLKANGAQNGHPGNSSPLDEQSFVVNTINFLESLPEWNETAVIIAWDDSDGWYDHVDWAHLTNEFTSPRRTR